MSSINIDEAGERERLGLEFETSARGKNLIDLEKSSYLMSKES